MKWSTEDLDALRRLYPTAPIMEVRRALPGRVWQTIRRKANELGLHRPALMANGDVRVWTRKPR